MYTFVNEKRPRTDSLREKAQRSGTCTFLSNLDEANDRWPTGGSDLHSLMAPRSPSQTVQRGLRTRFRRKGVRSPPSTRQRNTSSSSTALPLPRRAVSIQHGWISSIATAPLCPKNGQTGKTGLPTTSPRTRLTLKLHASPMRSHLKTRFHSPPSPQMSSLTLREGREGKSCADASAGAGETHQRSDGYLWLSGAAMVARCRGRGGREQLCTVHHGVGTDSGNHAAGPVRTRVFQECV